MVPFSEDFESRKLFRKYDPVKYEQIDAFDSGFSRKARRCSQEFVFKFSWKNLTSLENAINFPKGGILRNLSHSN